MGAVRDSLRNASRFAKRAPAITTIVVIILALGIGASTSIFSILYAVSLRPLPYKDPDQLVVLLRTQLTTSWFQGRTVTGPTQLPLVSGPDFLHWEKQSNAFSTMAGAEPYVARAVASGQKATLRGLAVTPDFFNVLGVRVVQGRFFAASDEQPGHDQVVILGPGLASRGTWASGVKVGGTLELNGKQYDVIGRAPDSFRMAAISSGAGANPTPDIFVPVPRAELNKVPSASAIVPGSLAVFGRLKPGITIAQAQAEMTTIAAGLAKQYPVLDQGTSVRVVSMQSQVGQVPGLLSKMLLVGVGFLLLIACVNIAVLLLTQGARRRREIAIRQAVGASRASIIGQLFAECLFLALAGAAGGILIAFWLKDALVSLIPASLLPVTAPVEINWQVLGFALGLSVALAVLFGLIPALQLSLESSSELLKEEAHAASGGVRSAWLRNAFVVCEVTLAFALLIVCGLMIRGITGEILGNPGFNPDRMVTMDVTLAPATYPSFASRENVYRRMLSRVDASGLVESSAMDGRLTVSHFASSDKPVTPRTIRESMPVMITPVSPDYFRTMQIPLQRGRPFAWSDYAEKPSVAIVSATTARMLWPKQDPVGKRITVAYPPEWMEIVGVAADASSMGIEAMKQWPQIYLPEFSSGASLMVRTASGGKGSMGAIHDMAVGIGPGVQVSAPKTVEDVMARVTKPVRYIEAILGFFGLMALLLATVGVFAVTAYSVSQRTHEIGVRMALGAQRRQVLFAVMREGTGLSLYGVGAGLLLALGLGKVLVHFMSGVGVGTLSTYFGVALLLLAVAVTASYVAARRATHIDPISALRCE